MNRIVFHINMNRIVFHINMNRIVFHINMNRIVFHINMNRIVFHIDMNYNFSYQYESICIYHIFSELPISYLFFNFRRNFAIPISFFFFSFYILGNTQIIFNWPLTELPLTDALLN